MTPSSMICAIELDPLSVLAHYRLAQALLALGQTAAALEEYQTVLSLQPDHKDARQAVRQITESGNASPAH